LLAAAGQKITEPFPAAGEIGEAPLRLQLQGSLQRTEPGLLLSRWTAQG
jgi:hypothetical protein